MDSIKADVTGAADQGGTGLMKASSPVSRRTVVATGVAAAWTIPVIQLATAAPALAASTSTWGLFTAEYPQGNAKNLHVMGSVTYQGAKTASDFVVTITLDSSMSGATASAASGWTVGGSGRVFTLTPTAQPAVGETKTFDLTFTLPNSNGIATSISAVATAGKGAWSAVAQVVATTALSWTSLTAYYSNGDASQLAVAAKVAASSKADAIKPVVTLTLDTSLSGAVPAVPSGWSVQQSSNVFKFTRAADLPAGTSDTLNVAFATGNTTGKGFTLNAAADAPNAPQVTTTAPVTAVPNLTLSSVTAGYGSGGTDAGTVVFSATVGNSGSANTTGGQLKITLPAAAGVPSNPNGWILSSHTTTEFVFTRQIAAGESKPFSVTFPMASSDGNAGTVTAVLSATNAVSRTATATLSALVISAFTASSSGTGQKTLAISGLKVRNTDTSTSSGTVRLTITVPADGATTNPTITTDAPTAWTPAGGSTPVGGPYVYIYTYASLAPKATTATAFSLTLSCGANQKNAAIAADAVGDHGNTAQQVTAKAS